MTKIILILTFFIFGFLLYAQAQLTNQVAITPSLRFELLQELTAISTNRFNSNGEILFTVTATDLKSGTFALLPPDQTFIFDLCDSKGKSVSKTAEGLKMSKPLDITKGARELQIRHYPISPDHGILNNLFVPENYFVITNKGVYTLKVQIRVWTQKTNGQYGVIVSPPVRVEVWKRTE